MSEIWQLSATELAHRIAHRDLSSAEVVDAHLSRIEAANPALNAVVRVLADEARAGAALADRKLAAGEKLGPLHGVPFTVKENIDMAGLPTTWGVAGAGASRRASGRAGRRTHARRGRDTDRPHQSARYGASRAHP
jgi:amidase